MKALIGLTLGLSICVAAAGQVAPPPPTGNTPPTTQTCARSASVAANAATVVSVIGNVVIAGVGISGTQPVVAGCRLANADLLAVASNDAELQLECANGGTQTLSNSFEAIINGAGAPSQCAIDIKAGMAVATSNPDGSEQGRSSINGGPLAAQSTHTQFAISVPPGDPDNAEVFVIEGEAQVKRMGEAWQPLKGGELLAYRSPAVQAIPDARLQAVATNFVRLDAKRAGLTLDANAQAQLSQTYYASIRNPGNSEATAALARVYTQTAIPESAVTRYRAKRAVQYQQMYVIPPTPLQGNNVHLQGHTQMLTTRTFLNPMMKNHRVDLCLHWGVGCGDEAAHAFCAANKYTRAETWTQAANIGAQTPTLVIGDDRVCNDAACDGFSKIVCTR